MQKVPVTTPADWSSTLAEYVRNNDQQMLEAGDKLLAHYQDELLPCQSFAEFCDVAGMSLNKQFRWFTRAHLSKKIIS